MLAPLEASRRTGSHNGKTHVEFEKAQRLRPARKGGKSAYNGRAAKTSQRAVDSPITRRTPVDILPISWKTWTCAEQAGHRVGAIGNEKSRTA